MKLSFLKFILVLLIITPLTGCGFKLRGLQQVTLNISHIYLDHSAITVNYLNDQFVDKLISKLQDSNVKVDQRATPNAYTLKLVSTEYTKQITSTGSTHLVTQYKLNFNVTYSLYKNDKQILTNQMLTAQRNYSYKQNQILGLDYEEEAISRELLQEVAERIINQLTLVKL